MIETNPPRLVGAATSSIMVLLGLGSTSFGILRLAQSGMTPSLILWLVLGLLGLPLTLAGGYLAHGLLTARYSLDREGFDLTWGLARERIPIGEIQSVTALDPGEGMSGATAWLPGIVLGQAHEGDVRREFFATDRRRLVLVEAAERQLVISPLDPEAFVQGFLAATRMGSLGGLEAIHQRPDLLPARLWGDATARLLILIGLVLPLTMLGYLALQAGSLPESLPFGYLPGGEPGPLAPAGRLLLLPLNSGLVWLADLLLGVWLYRNGTGRQLAQLLWGAGALVGVLYWAALLQMLAPFL